MKNKTKDSIENAGKQSGGKKGLKVVKTILNVIINILIVAVLVVSILVAVLALTSKNDINGLPNIFGYTLQYVQTPSMDTPSPDGYPGGNFSEKDVIIGRIYSEKEFPVLNVGDIITYNSHLDDGEGHDMLISHRIVDKHEMSDGSYTYQTWGDNREAAKTPDQKSVDEYLSTYDIVSVNYTENYQGPVLKGYADFFRLIRSQAGFFGIILIPMIIFFLYALVRVIISAMNYKKEMSDEEKQEAEQKKQEEIDAAVAAALAAQNGGEQTPGESAQTADMTPEQMEQFKQFLAFQKAQQAANDPAPTEDAPTENAPAEEKPTDEE